MPGAMTSAACGNSRAGAHVHVKVGTQGASRGVKEPHMSIFPPPNSCYDPGATRLWLVAVMVGLVVMGIALLVQVGMLWRGMMQAHVGWWQRLPVLLPLVWTGFCAFDV